MIERALNKHRKLTIAALCIGVIAVAVGVGLGVFYLVWALGAPYLLAVLLDYTAAWLVSFFAGRRFIWKYL